MLAFFKYIYIYNSYRKSYLKVSAYYICVSSGGQTLVIYAFLIGQIHVHLPPVPPLDDNPSGTHHCLQYGRLYLLHRRNCSSPLQDYQSNPFQLLEERHHLDHFARTGGRGFGGQLHLPPRRCGSYSDVNMAGPRIHRLSVLPGAELFPGARQACDGLEPHRAGVHAPSQWWAWPC